MSIVDQFWNMDNGSIVTGKIGRHTDGDAPNWITESVPISVYVQKDKKGHIVSLTPTKAWLTGFDNPAINLNEADYDPRHAMVQMADGSLWLDAEEFIFVIEAI